MAAFIKQRDLYQTTRDMAAFLSNCIVLLLFFVVLVPLKLFWPIGKRGFYLFATLMQAAPPVASLICAKTYLPRNTVTILFSCHFC
jgi:hypothetical protein